MDISLIRQCLKSCVFTSHAKNEMLYEEAGPIREHEVKEALQKGEIIEEYQEDRPYPSCLVFGRTNKGRSLHVVCAPVESEGKLVIITVYQPSEELWVDLRRRRE